MNINMSNYNLECGNSTGVYLNDYELKTGDEVKVFTFNSSYLVWTYRSLGVVEKIEDGFVRIVTNKETTKLCNDDVSKNDRIKLSKKQYDYKKGEMVAKGKIHDGFIVE